MSWQSVLEKVIAVAGPALAHDETRWAIIGSVATALQGCRVSPKDIDILTARPEGVFRFAELMSGYTVPRREHQDHDEWLSTIEDPVSSGPDDQGFYWYFARWIVNGVKVEVAHIVGPEGYSASEAGAGVWEAGPAIWPHIREVRFRGYGVPVVPLEIQLETSFQRGIQQRVVEIVGVLKREGYDEELIEWGLSPDHFAEFKQSVEPLGVLSRPEGGL